MKDIVVGLYNSMSVKLKDIAQNEQNPVRTATMQTHVVSQTIAELKSYVLGYQFQEREEEIDFFKNLKPLLYSSLLYYNRVLEIEINAPVSQEDRRLFFEQELRRISNFFERKRHWVTYYRTYATYLDEKYFLRNESASDPTGLEHSLTSDTRFCTIGSVNFSRIRCCEMLTKELERRLQQLSGLSTPTESISTDYELRWTASKADAIELLYILRSAGAFNNGTADMKQIATWFEQTLHIDLGNYYRVIQGIRIRKKNLTQFWDRAKQSFTQWVDETDENPRF